MEQKSKSQILEEIKNMGPEVRNVKKEHRSNLSPSERFAVKITNYVGSMGFFFIVAVWTLGWLVWNMIAPAGLTFDPAPAFVIWLFISNVIQLVLLPLIMVGQNLQGRYADIRSEADFEVNQRSAKEIKTIITYLEEQDELLTEIVKKLYSNGSDNNKG